MDKKNIRIGTSGFSFPDWYGTVYPENLKKQEELIYYNKNLGFDCVEINSTYYTIISEKASKAMSMKTDINFEFIVKCYKGITHDPFDYRIEKKPDENVLNDYFERFVSSITPFMDEKKLGCVLLQFPIFFYPGTQANDYLLKCKEKLKSFNLVIEFRNSAWVKKETFDFLKKNNLGFCVVDEPQLKNLMPFVNTVTSDIAYLRLHGRNKNWFNAKDTSSRYDYFYSDKELKDFLPEIKKMSENSLKTYIFFNNCHAGSAAKNASRMKELLKFF